VISYTYSKQRRLFLERDTPSGRHDWELVFDDVLNFSGAPMATQQLATREDFYIHGLEKSRIKDEYTSDEDSSVIDAWLRAASGKVLDALGHFMILPLVSWGEVLIEYVCVLAAYSAKSVIGLPSSEVEWPQIEARYAFILDELERWTRRKRAPTGTIDSSGETDSPDEHPGTPKIGGYRAININPW